MYVLPATEGQYVCTGGAPGEDDDAEYIATMHPGVALALAALLDAAADYTVPDPHDPSCDCCPCCERDRNALAVADAILGGQS